MEAVRVLAYPNLRTQRDMMCTIKLHPHPHPPSPLPSLTLARYQRGELERRAAAAAPTHGGPDARVAALGQQGLALGVGQQGLASGVGQQAVTSGVGASGFMPGGVLIASIDYESFRSHPLWRSADARSNLTIKRTAGACSQLVSSRA